jgi:hypothetical protein
MRKYNCASDLLVGMTGVNAELDMRFDGFIKFGS